MANGAGIDFSASEGGGADNSLLDDYEEGTWTPAWSFSTSGSAALTVDHATYTKIGNVVTARFRGSTSSISSPTGNATLDGLPFTSNGIEQAAFIGRALRFLTDMPNIKAVLTGGTNEIVFYKNATNSSSGSALLGSDFSGVASRNIISVTTVYKTDS